MTRAIAAERRATGAKIVLLPHQSRGREVEGELAAEGEPAAAGEPNAPSARTLENSRRSKEARGEFTPPDTRSQLPRSGGAHIHKIRLTLSPLSLVE